MDTRVNSSEEVEVRKGPWTMEEDLILANYIASHGEGVWNSLARSAGLKRTGKSCRLRWLNYLKPDVRRGNITIEEQLLIMELHERWGNRWSKIARQFPGRTDNEIKNYFRTRLQKKVRNDDSIDYSRQMAHMVNEEIITSSLKSLDQEEIAQPSYHMHFNGKHEAYIPAWDACDLSENFWNMEDYWSMESGN
ncbi:hypothetical protein IEQ34_003335 [Dendrobium chrysotoxum]|uniref:Uncharacterized protein n=1 Tax=Dendrobium chrysotoxum TaxID=161865 RepID=A0AAV7HKB7_DENCH|nr:hypothetical protein IEQ34_003335 [Dendrobium chrysotoxum]